MLSAPPQRPLSTRASTRPPPAGAGPASRPTPPPPLPPPPAPPPPFPPAVPRPAHVASCPRPAAAPHSNPATPINPIAAPTGAWRATESAPISTLAPTAHIPTPHAPKEPRPAQRPAPNATLIHTSGGRIAASPCYTNRTGFAPQRGASRPC